ncbi:disease resistance protein RFL1-like isoform X1 [Vitis riparia]|uniref:disease resistance protein RFL1-like isoform X1 n=1 Tax=Vitis riparia TaxID=96939 RepID=UPI00155B122B|nr:disease resistance protein RFL1-like isoform X1 [Vitis riparia]XP_034680453.1 disease resistance protein RFL1-like isoform X1 [Vitis riparia]
MDCVSPIYTIATDLFGCTAKRASHIRGLRENLECLREEMELLNLRSEDVKTRVELGKQQQMTPRREVEGWIQDVGEEESEVAAILREGDGALEKECLGRFCNIRSSYNLGKRVSRKISRVRELSSRGDFEAVAYTLPRDVVDELPLVRTVGLDSLYEKVCSFLAQDSVGIVGLYGKRGIGKTTLMKKINNALLETRHDFDTVIWVSVSKQASVGAAQDVIGNKLQIIDSMWQNRSQDEKAIEIFKIMKTKRFLLLLDNVQKPLDLSEIGVPPPDAGNKSKVIIATRSMRICSEMDAKRWLPVKPLACEEAWTLFSELVGEDTLNSSPGIQQLAHSTLERCQGLPSAIVMAGRTLAGCKIVREWEHLTQELEDLIKEEISGEDRLPRDVVDELPLGRTVGLDSLYEKVCSFLAQDSVGIVGLYGKRGIGKTTLMKKINNALLETRHDFDTVIWVSVSKQASVRAAQDVIGNKLQIIDSMWQNRSQDEKAIEIFNIMKTKRFLLLLDNVQIPLDLSEIGVPPPGAGNKSKVIIATRSMRICSEMDAKRWLPVKPLACEEAWTLFSELVGEDTLNSSPGIQQLAHSTLERCQGLPSAIIMAGRTLAGCKIVREWERLAQELEDVIKEEISGEDRLPHAVVDEMPLGHTVGLDSLYERVCRCLTGYQAGIIALYGTGGVGKTTLMRKINNEFLKTSHQFDTVIWVTLPKQASVKAAQEVIRNKLQIPDSMWQGRTEDERATEIFNIMKTRRFVLLLDDVWQRLDLSKIGVPLPEIRNRSQVIITTRIQEICNEMEVQRIFRVECLAQEEALALFLEKVGENTLNSHPDISRLSKKMAEQCKGLPLALITVGRAMAHKNSPHEWDQAIQELEKFPVEISGMEDELYHVLKLSYDSLRDDITKSCFRYCSFFPKEYEIRKDELIEHWIGEGFFDGKDIYEARRQGHKIIEDLKNACLLEEGDGFKECIKMHDVIHDMALWIGQECGKKMNKILVRESLGHVEAERVTSWKEAERISLWGWNIEKLPGTPHCSNLQTLFVRECIRLRTFPRGFFQFMPLIRVLDLSATHCLMNLPVGIDRLMNLEYINLSMTKIRELPIGIKKLTKLRCLLLDGVPPFVIPPHVISSLSSLQLFSMYDGNALSSDHEHLLEELESIESMDEISLSFCSDVALNKLQSSDKLLRRIRRLSLHDCKNLLLLMLSTKFLSYLETFVIFNGRQLEGIYRPVEFEDNQHFHRLRHVKIWSCPELRHLGWLIYAVHLESLNVQFCESMAVVISAVDIANCQHASPFTRLASLVLGGMPELDVICPWAVDLPSLEVISVINCPKLRRLPFNSNSATKSLKKIEGDLTWWESLEWEDGSTKEIFANYFSPQYLADPIHHSGEAKGKKILVVEGSTSRTTT